MVLRFIKKRGHHYLASGVTVAVAVVMLSAQAYWLSPKLASATEASSAASLYYGFILSAVAIIFSISFADARHWPNITFIARHCLILPWLSLGVIATAFSWLGAHFDQSRVAAAGSALWMMGALLGTYSLRRVIKLADSKTLATVMTSELRETLMHGRDVEPFRRELMESIAGGDVLNIRDLAGQVQGATACLPSAIVAHELRRDFTQAVVRSAMLGGIDGGTAAYAIATTLGPESARQERNSMVEHDADLICLQSPIVARFEHQSRLLHEKGATSLNSAMEIGRASVSLHEQLRVLYDPEPKLAMHPAVPSAQTLKPQRAVECYRALTVRPVTGSTNASYALYQHLSGKRYGGNYFSGAPLLADVLGLADMTPTLRLAVEFTVAEQLLTCTTRLERNVIDCWHSARSRRLVTAVLRICGSMPPFPDGLAARDAWLATVTQFDSRIPGYAVPALPSPPSLLIAIGLALSHLVRLSGSDVDLTKTNCELFLSLLPADMASVTRRRMSSLLSVEEGKDPWGALARISHASEDVT